MDEEKVSRNEEQDAAAYADHLIVQLKKGLLSYLVILTCSRKIYTSEILKKLRAAGLEVEEGTIYPLLARIQRDGLLTHTWQESSQGPPRKYYKTTPYGREVAEALAKNLEALNKTINVLERSKK